MKDIKYKYIGIRGHRGSGKNTIAYLLANTIQFICENKLVDVEEIVNLDSFKLMWRVSCDCIIADEHSALEEMNTPKVYLDSFGYTPKFLIELLTDIPHEYFNSDYHKDHVIVNVSNFSWRIVDDPSQEVTFDYQGLLDEIEKGNIEDIDNEDIHLSLRDFIVYFATVSMKYLGHSVWVKAVRCQENRDKMIQDTYGDTYGESKRFKIFTDIKASSELTYIKDRGGKIVKVDRPEHKKRRKGVEQLDSDNRFDFEIHNTDIYSESFMRDLVNIAYSLTYEN